MRAASTLFVCASFGLTGAPVPHDADTTPDYFPTRVGDRWVYLRKAPREADFELVETVAKVERKDGVSVVIINRFERDGSEHYSRRREVSASGVLQPDDDGDYKTPWVHLKLPHREGQSWNVPQDGHTYTAFGPEEVKVPAGTFRAIRVEHSKQVGGKRQVSTTIWYATRVGLVRLTDRDVTYEMKSFTPGKP